MFIKDKLSRFDQAFDMPRNMPSLGILAFGLAYLGAAHVYNPRELITF